MLSFQTLNSGSINSKEAFFHFFNINIIPGSGNGFPEISQVFKTCEVFIDASGNSILAAVRGFITSGNGIPIA